MAGEPIRTVLTGQSLIEEPLEPTDAGRWEELNAWIAEGDARFTNLEVAICDGRPCWPMKEHTHTPGPEVLDDLEGMGFNLYSLANNHAWDAGVDGLLDTLEQMEARSLAHAGTGRDLLAAQEPAYLETEGGTVALVAMASGLLPPQAFATRPDAGGRPGVNPVDVRTRYQLPPDDYSTLERVRAEFESDQPVEERLFAHELVEGEGYAIRREVAPDDRDRHLRIVREAAEEADLVLVYLHQHHWEPDRLGVGPWLREFARDCIDAGAHGFMGHGVPLLQPIEVYEGMPIVYSLGNFVFHSYKPTEWTDPWVWQSAILEGSFADGEWRSLEARPITLASPDVLESDDFSRSSRHCPMAAEGEQADAIVERLGRISEPFGTRVESRDGHGEIVMQ